MLHPKNSKAPITAQQLQTTLVSFANQCRGELLSVRAGVPATEALRLARNLANGLQCIAGHLGDVINSGDDLHYLDEMSALGFLSETVAALIFSVERGMEAQGGEA